MPHTDELRPQSPPIGWFLVAFLDVLGQSEALSGLRRFPDSEETRAALAKTLYDTAGVIVSLRHAFQSYFETASDASTRVQAEIPEQARAEYRAVRQVEAWSHGFSDSFVITVPLVEGAELMAISACEARLADGHVNASDAPAAWPPVDASRTPEPPTLSLEPGSELEAELRGGPAGHTNAEPPKSWRSRIE